MYVCITVCDGGSCLIPTFSSPHSSRRRTSVPITTLLTLRESIHVRPLFRVALSRVPILVRLGQRSSVSESFDCLFKFESS